MRMLNTQGALALALAIACSCCARAQQDGRVTFRYRPPQVGEENAGDKLMQYQFQSTLSQNGQVIRRKSNEVSQQRQTRVRVLASDGQAATKIAVRYDRARRNVADADHPPSAKDEAVAGKSYVVQRRDKRLVIARDSGDKVSSEERDLLERYHHTLGHRNVFSRLLDGRTLAPGETVRLKTDEVREILGIKAESIGQVEHFTLTFTGTRRVGNELCGVFEASASIELPDLAVTAPFRGEYVVTVDGLREASLDLSAPLRSKRRQAFDTDAFDFVGEGQLRLVYQVQPLRR